MPDTLGSRDYANDQALSGFWDQIARGDPSPGPVDPDLAAVIRWVHALPDVPPIDRAFIRELQEDLMLPQSTALPLSRGAGAFHANGAHGASAAAAPWVKPPPARSHRQSRRPLIAIGTLVALALVAVSLFVIQKDEPAPLAVIPAVQQATPETAQAGAQHVWTVKGEAPAFQRPLATMGPDGNLWVVNSGGNIIQIFGTNGNEVDRWGSYGTGEGKFGFAGSGSAPAPVAFDADGNIYIFEPFNKRVQKFDKDRNFLTMWGSRGDGDGQFIEPLWIEIAPNGDVVTFDGMRLEFQVFDPEGAFLYKWGETGSSPGQLAEGAHFDIDDAGIVYVAEWGNDRVELFDLQGNYLRSVGSEGTEPGQLQRPLTVTVDPAGNIYVADDGNGRITVYDNAGNYLVHWGEYGGDDGEFLTPDSIVIDGSEVYVTDYSGGRLQKFTVTLPSAPPDLATPKPA